MKPLFSILLLIGTIALPIQSWSWQGTPLLKQTQQPMRSIELPGNWNAKQWAQQHQLKDWQIQQGQGGKQFINFRADDQQWQQLSQQCQSGGFGPQCSVDTCQGVRAATQQPVKRWLTPKAPDLKAALSGQGQSCPSNLQAQPFNGSFPQGSDPACWNLQQLQPCQSEETPAEYLKPHWRANMLLVSLPAEGEAAEALAQRNGLRLISETQLKSTGDRLAVMLRVEPGISLDDWVITLKSDQNTLEVQKEFAYFTMADEADPLAAFNYGPALSQSDRLAVQYDGGKIPVAVIDTGVDLTHPEL
ncbi:MAG: hypothetical protein OQJ91_05260, partial [Motiliproteus sp.]|nr:hypothetical protein [Motiliproteus sp.]